MPKCIDCGNLKEYGPHLGCDVTGQNRGKWISRENANNPNNDCAEFIFIPKNVAWLPKNPYPETISDDASSTMVSNPRYNYWLEGMMVAAGNIYTRGNELCPHAAPHGIHMTKRECAICWDGIFVEMNAKQERKQ